MAPPERTVSGAETHIIAKWRSLLDLSFAAVAQQGQTGCSKHGYANAISRVRSVPNKVDLLTDTSDVCNLRVFKIDVRIPCIC